MVGQMMWFRRDPKVSDSKPENGVVSKLRRKKAVLKPTRESERETSTESEKERRRYSDILDMKVSLERRDESDESLYESADCHSDAISASDDALPRLRTPTISKESLKLAVTDEEADLGKTKKCHRKTMSLSNPLEIMRSFGDEWLDSAKKELEKNTDRLKSRESLWSEEEKDSISENVTKKEKSLPNSRKSSTTEAPKTRKPSKASSVSALNFLRRKKNVVKNEPEPVIMTDEILNTTKSFLEEEKRHSSQCQSIEETDTEDEVPKKVDHKRRLSRQTSRSKSKLRGKSQSVKVNTLRKSHSGTLKKNKKKGAKTPIAGRSRQTSIVDATPILKKKHSESLKHNSWLFSSGWGETRREGSSEEPAADADLDVSDAKLPDKDSNCKAAPPSGGARVNRAESCRERDAPRRGKHRNASDPNRLTAHTNHDLEPGAPAAPSGSSSSSSLSSRSNESNTAPPDQQGPASDWSEEEEPLAAAWADSLPAGALARAALQLAPARRKRQELIHELIVSEGSHVRWLKVLGKVFLRPLEAQPNLLPPEELRALLPNLPAVRDRHSKLYADLRAARNEASDLVVKIRPVADAVLNTLGDSGYLPCLARFCRQQRRALETLRERRRKSKELHAFLAAREQLPLCGRLQLRDLLACVWQRLTKYQLLLEGILKTVSEEEIGGESGSVSGEEDLSRLRRALDTAKDVLHGVDTAIRTAENEHRLRTIQSKLEVRSGGAECEELRRLDLTTKVLRTEGELAIRGEGTKKTSVLALHLEDMLVLLHREGDKFVLKPFSQPNQKAPLSPVILWNKVLFRANAAERHTFFLMNINQVQMHELSAHSASEYATWVKYIQESPLARLTDLKPGGTRSHDNGTNVSRNPSDASEKSSTTEDVIEETEPDTSALSAPSEPEKEAEAEEEKQAEAEPEAGGEEEKEQERPHVPRRPTVGRISWHGGATPPLESAAALIVTPPAAAGAQVAEHVVTQLERLRRLDEDIAKALRDKSELVGTLLGIPTDNYSDMADLAVADTLGHVDVSRELARSNSAGSAAGGVGGVGGSGDAQLHPLLLAAQAQAHQLTELLSRELTVSEASLVSAAGRCGACALTPGRARAPRDASFDLLPELCPAPAAVPVSDASGARLAWRLAPLAAGLHRALSAALAALGSSSPGSSPPGVGNSGNSGNSPGIRESRAMQRDENDWLRDRLRRLENQLVQEIAMPKDSVDQTIQDQPSNENQLVQEIAMPKDSVDQTIQDQPSNGG